MEWVIPAGYLAPSQLSTKGIERPLDDIARNLRAFHEEEQDGDEMRR
jgi:hypothetical protein